MGTAPAADPAKSHHAPPILSSQEPAARYPQHASSVRSTAPPQADAWIAESIETLGMNAILQAPTLTPGNLVFSARKAGSADHSDPVGPRIARDVYLPHDAFEGLQEAWQAEHLVAQARIFAEATRLDARFESRAMTMSSALILYGIDTWVRNPPVVYRPAEAPGRGSILPEVSTPFGPVPSTRSKPLIFARRDAIEESRQRRSDLNKEGSRLPDRQPSNEDIIIEPLEQVAVDIARRQPPLAATADVSMVLARLSNFDRRDPQQSRRRERDCRRRLLEMNEKLPTQHRRLIAEAVLCAADAGVESHAEGALRWVVLNVLDTDVIRRWFDDKLTSQHEVRVGLERFYLDMALPKLGVAIEFEGMGKLAAGGPDPGARIREYFARRDALMRAGWHYVAVTYGELFNPVALAMRLQDELGRLKVPVQSDISAVETGIPRAA